RSVLGRRRGERCGAEQGVSAAWDGDSSLPRRLPGDRLAGRSGVVDPGDAVEGNSLVNSFDMSFSSFTSYQHIHGLHSVLQGSSALRRSAPLASFAETETAASAS